MKNLLKSLTRRIVSIEPVWKMIASFHRAVGALYGHLYFLRNPQEFVASASCPKRSALVERLFSEKTVLHGPFQGMRYPEMVATGSEIYPKLLGSYEKEIQPLIETICRSDYSLLVDVGCAEGYYAVGLGLAGKFQRIQAFDLNPEARTLCEAMANANNVKIEVKGECSPETLCELESESRALIFCDCEGYEKHLFTPAVVRALIRHDVFVETHDFSDIEITRLLIDAFSPTHDISVFESRDDLLKAYEYDYPELVGLSLDDRKFLLEERRPTIMRWLFCAARES